MHRRVDGKSFACLAALRVFAVDVREVQAAAEQGFDVALFAGGFARCFHVVAHFGVAREVGVDVVGGLAARDVELAREAEGAHAVDEAEVDGFGVAALFAADGVRRDAEDFGGGGAVDVVASGKGGEQAGVGGEVRHDAQFDLGVVGGEDLPAVCGDEGAADAAACVAAHRDVLQVGVAR